MRSLLSAAFLLPALSLTVSAQTLFEIWPSCTTHTWRGAIGVNAGEVLMQIPGSHVIGVGHIPQGNGFEMTGMRIGTQDQDAATQESYRLILRRDLAGSPNCTTIGLVFSAGPFYLPPATGTKSWILTTGFGSPVQIPRCQSMYPGVELIAAPAWPADGQSVHMSMYTTASNVSAGAVNLAWNCYGGVPSQPGPKRTMRIGLLVDAAVLNMGNVDVAGTRCMGANPDFGGGGLWPVSEGTTGTQRNDALVARVRDAQLPDGFFMVRMWPTTSCASAYPWPIVQGAWYLSPTFAEPTIATGFLVGGEATVPTFLTSPIVKANSAALSLPMYYQAVVTDGSTFRLTNRTATVFGTP